MAHHTSSFSRRTVAANPGRWTWATRIGRLSLLPSESAKHVWFCLFYAYFCLILCGCNRPAGCLDLSPSDCLPDHAPPLTDLHRYEFSQPLMGTRGRIVLYAPDERSAREAAAAAFDRIEQLEQVMSDYREDSELMQVCGLAGQQDSIAISPDLTRILSQSLEVSRATDGAFDITIGPVVQLWRQARKTGILPDSDRLAEARARIGTDLIHLDMEQRTVRLDVPGMRLDLGGIGKGFAAEEALRTLREQFNLPCALIDLGGDLRIGSAPPDRPDGWSIAIQTHDPASIDRTVHLADCAIATSGDLDQYAEIDGVRYSHIVDPHNGMGLTNRVAVTVIGPDAATADALASAISVLGADKGIEVLRAKFPEYAASVAVLADRAGAVSHVESSGFAGR